MNSISMQAAKISAALLSKDAVKEEQAAPAQVSTLLPLADLKKICQGVKTVLTTPVEQGGWGLPADLFAMVKGQRTLLTVEPYMEYAKSADGKVDFNTVVKHSNTILLKDAGFQVNAGGKSFWTGGNSWTLGFGKKDENGLGVIVEPWNSKARTEYHERQVVLHALLMEQAKGAPAQPARQ